MTALTKRQQRIFESARELVSERWISGGWVQWRRVMSWTPAYADKGRRVEHLRGWLGRKEPLVEAAEKCLVCPEGAVYLTCALDPRATDEDASAVLRHMTKRLPLMSRKEMVAQGFESRDALLHYPSVPSFNDSSGWDPEKIIKTLFGDGGGRADHQDQRYRRLGSNAESGEG